MCIRDRNGQISFNIENNEYHFIEQEKEVRVNNIIKLLQREVGDQFFDIFHSALIMFAYS